MGDKNDVKIAKYNVLLTENNVVMIKNQILHENDKNKIIPINCAIEGKFPKT